MLTIIKAINQKKIERLYAYNRYGRVIQFGWELTSSGKKYKTIKEAYEAFTQEEQGENA